MSNFDTDAVYVLINGVVCKKKMFGRFTGCLSALSPLLFSQSSPLATPGKDAGMNLYF